VGCSYARDWQRSGLLCVRVFCSRFHSIFTFPRGNIDLPRIFPFLGKSQLQVLSVVVSILLLGGHIVMASLVKEKVLLKSDR